MEAVAQDSLKHSMIYEAVLELLSKEHPFIAEEESEEDKEGD